MIARILRRVAALFTQTSTPADLEARFAPSPIDTYRSACEQTKARLDQAELEFGHRVEAVQAQLAERKPLDLSIGRPRRLRETAHAMTLDGLRQAIAEGNADRGETLFYRLELGAQEHLLPVLRQTFGPTFALRGPRAPGPFWLDTDLREEGLTYDLADEPPPRRRT